MRVLIVDDHPIVISGCKAMLAAEEDIIVFDAGCSETGFAAFCTRAPDVCVIDINLPGVSGFELTRRIIRHKADAGVLIFSMNEDPIFAARAIESGARGYLTKNDDPSLFVDALRVIAAGGSYLSPDLAKKLAFQRNVAAISPLHDLRSRDLEILGLLAQGQSLAEIANHVRVSYKTIANSCAMLKRKLGARTTADLVRMAVEQRLG